MGTWKGGRLCLPAKPQHPVENQRLMRADRRVVCPAPGMFQQLDALVTQSGEALVQQAGLPRRG